MRFTISLLLPLLLLSCSSKNNGWQKVEPLNSAQCTNRKTACTTNHQGEHTVNSCVAFIDGDTLHIAFPAELPAYWLGASLKVYNGHSEANVSGIPFVSTKDELTHSVAKHQLWLQKQQYSTNDTLIGYVDIEFEEHSDAKKAGHKFYFRGCIHKIIRPKDYQPFEDSAAFLNLDMELAVSEMGEPLSEYTFTTQGLPEFRIELLNIFPPSDSIHIRELTWNTSDDGQLSDGGIHRLTVWYAQRNSVWMPVHFLRWTTNMQF